jgi:hypothetical protein
MVLSAFPGKKLHTIHTSHTANRHTLHTKHTAGQHTLHTSMLRDGSVITLNSRFQRWCRPLPRCGLTRDTNSVPRNEWFTRREAGAKGRGSRRDVISGEFSTHNPPPAVDKRNSGSGLTTLISADFVFVKPLAKVFAEGGILFHMLARPDADLHHPLELFGGEVPAIGVTETVGRQVVVNGMFAAGAVGEYVVGRPFGSLNSASADVASACGFLECDIASR